MPSAIIYARISDTDQSNYSIDAQVAACQEWCEKAGYDVFATMIEPGRSAATDNRPLFQRAVNAVLSGRAEVLVVHKFDRFARNTLDSRFWKTKLRESGADVISVTEPIEDTPAGAMMEQILEVFAEYYLLNLSFEVKKGMTQKAKAGYWPTGRITTGYKMVEGNIVPTEQGELIGIAFREFATGDYTLQSWTNEAYRRGYRGERGGKKIYPSVWLRIFKNPFYLGVINWMGETYPGQHPPLTDQKTFDRVQEVLVRQSHPKRSHHFFLLKGLLHSTLTERNMTGNAIKKSNGKRFYYYRAKSKKKGVSEHNVRAEKLEEQVEQVLKRIYLTDAVMAAVPPHYELALKSSPSVWNVYRVLDEKEEKREILKTVFAPLSIKVGKNGLECYELLPGFGIRKKVL